MISALNIYQRNGCYDIAGIRKCPGPSFAYKCTAITGANNIEVTKQRPNASQFYDGVPIDKGPDHLHMLDNYNGYAAQIGAILK